MGLRALFILAVVVLNIPLALLRPFQGLLLYAFLAYSRPDALTWGAIANLRLSLLTGIALAIGTFLNRERFCAANKRIIAIILFWLLCFLSLIFSGNIWTYEFDYFTKTIIIILLVTGLVNTRQKFYLFCLVITGFIALYSARQGFVGFALGAQNQGGHVGENNYYAVWLCTLFPFVWYMARVEHRKWIKYLFYICLPGMFLAVLNTWSRGGYLGIIAVIYYLAFQTKHKIRNIVLITILGMVGFGLLPSGIKEEALSIKTVEERSESSALGRVHFWKIALIMTAKNPVLGVGFKNFEKKYDEYDDSYGQYGHDRSVHETFLQVLSENGVPAFLIFISCFVSVFTTGYMIRRRLKVLSPQDQARFKQWSFMLEGGLVGFSVCGLFVSAGYLDILWYLFALSIALDEIVKSEIRNLRMNSKPSH